MQNNFKREEVDDVESSHYVVLISPLGLKNSSVQFLMEQNKMLSSVTNESLHWKPIVFYLEFFWRAREFLSSSLNKSSLKVIVWHK